MERISAHSWIASRSLLTLMLLLLAAACGSIAPTRFSGDVDFLLQSGETYVDRLESTPGESLTDAEVLALGYLERVRLGLGSPFRIVDYVLRDPDLPDSIKEPLAYGILSRVTEGHAYFVDPGVLELARLTGVPEGRETGLAQMELIERTIMAAPSATAGERSVRLGYMLAAAERTVDPGQSSILAHVAALVADRRRSREDAGRLLRTAAARDADPLVLLQQWRRNLRFTVEQPSHTAVTVRDEEAEARSGPALALALRTLAQRESAPGSLVRAPSRLALGEAESLLDPSAAARLQELARERNYPAQAPIAVAIAINQDGFVQRPGLLPAQRQARARFAEESWNEERLVSGVSILRSQDAWGGVRPRLILLQAATFLRVWNQEEPWFPGEAAPSSRELQARFGIESISFDDDVHESWKPYYLRMLGRGLADMQRVLPTLTLRGLNIHFGEVDKEMNALALHEPRRRTLYLPPKTGAGTIAHELAHDLDWQLARSRYSARGGYATDLAVRNRRGDRIAAAMMELSSSLAQPATDPSSRHNSRPAEVFARGTDWLVATALAREGRIGGYLTSFQDPVLTGYGTTRGPDISGSAVPALISLLNAVSEVPEETREWIMSRHGPRRSLTGMELARVVVEAGTGMAPEQRLAEIQRVAEQSFQAVSDCRYGSAGGIRRLAAAQGELARASVSAAARGAAIDAVHALAEEVAQGSRHLVDEWLAWRLYGAPEPVDPLLEQLAPAFEDILLRAGWIESVAGTMPATPTAFQSRAVSPLCGGNPFAADTPAGRLRG